MEEEEVVVLEEVQVLPEPADPAEPRTRATC